MKAMCIDDKQGKYSKCPFKVGDIVTVKQCPVFEGNYDVIEYPSSHNGQLCSWVKTRFIPLSDIDEKELIKERELVNA